MGCGSSKDVVTDKEENTAPLTENNNVTDSRVVVKNEELVGNTIVNNGNSKSFYNIGDRVHVRGYVGTVKFLGETKLGDGEWIGIELDKQHPQGNNGSFEETLYFTCKPKHGLIVRPEVVSFLEQELDEKLSSISPETIVFIQTKMRRLLAKMRFQKLQERSGNEKVIDKHVMNTPKQEEESVNRLAVYLTKPFSQSRDKAFAIYRWMTFNIAYDVDGFFGNNSRKSCSAEDVLKNKLSVCAGYSDLFEAMGKAAGLEIHVVSGYAKGYGHRPGQRVEGTNHAWNALRIDDQWYLSDATWGAGNVGNDMMFHREPNTYRFLMDPEYAILDHLPEDNKWQFLDEPVAKETFANAAVMSGVMYSMGIELISHQNLHYSIDNDSIDITFYCPGKKMILMSKIKDSSGKQLPGQERTQIRPCGINQVRLRGQFPSPGTYKIDIYVNVEGSWNYGMTYIVKTTKGCGDDRGGFPQISGNFYDNGFDLISPFENIETSNGKAEIKLECFSKRFRSISGNILGVNGSEKYIAKNQCLCFAERTTNGFSLKVDTPCPGTYILNMFAKEDSDNSVYLCKYYITNTEENKRNIAGFPRLSDSFHAFNLQLVEPRENVSTMDGHTTIKIQGASKMSLTCSLKQDSGERLPLQENQVLCLCEKSDDIVTIKVDTPSQGMYTLNVFGKDEQEESNNQVWLCTYMIYSINPSKRQVFGFPRIVPQFHQWGLELEEPKENIHAVDGTAQIVIKCLDDMIDMLCNLIKDKQTLNGFCTTTINDDKKVISIKLPSDGMFGVNIFGKRENDTKYTFLLSYVIYSDKPSQ